MRTFFRYFASRDDILAALPRRQLEQMSERVRRRPPSESLADAFAAAEQEVDASPEERELVLLWGIVVHRSPDAAAAAMGRSAVDMQRAFGQLVAERLGVTPDDARAGALGAALAGVVGFTYGRWVEDGGQGRLDEMVTGAFRALADFQTTRPPS